MTEKPDNYSGDLFELYERVFGPIALLHTPTVYENTISKTFVTEADGVVLAAATGIIIRKHFGRPYVVIDDVAVLPEYRGKGLGRGVITQLEEWAKSQGCYKAVVMTGKQYEAEGFYEKLGFSSENQVAFTKHYGEN